MPPVKKYTKEEIIEVAYEIVEERARMSSTTIKGEKVFYEEHFYVCRNSSSNEFKTDALDDANLMSARNAYRKAHNLFTSDEIVAVRENYGLTQV